MKLKDDATLSIAAAVSDVLEGKSKKEEAKYPHDMFHPETGEKEVAKDEAEHKALAKKGYTHEKPEVEEAGEPKAKGEKEFKGKHTVKKSGEKEDGSVVKEDTFELVDMDDDTASNAVKLAKKAGLKAEVKKTKTGMDVTVSGDKKKVDKFVKSLPNEDVSVVKEEVTISITEAKLKAGKGKAKIDIDHEGDDIKATEKKFKVKFKKTKGGFDLSGQKKDILAYLQSKEYDMDAEDIEDLFPELMEAKSKFSKALLKKATDTALKMGGNMTGAVKKIEKMKKGLSDDPEVKAALQLANEEVTEEIVAEAHEINEKKTQQQEDKERYQKFFKSALKKFGVDSPAQLKGDKKKEFFDYVDKNYEADNESDVDEGLGSSIRKAAGKAKKAVKRATMSKAARSKADADDVFRKSRQKYR